MRLTSKSAPGKLKSALGLTVYKGKKPCSRSVVQLTPKGIYERNISLKNVDNIERTRNMNILFVKERVRRKNFIRYLYKRSITCYKHSQYDFECMSGNKYKKTLQHPKWKHENAQANMQGSFKDPKRDYIGNSALGTTERTTTEVI